MTSYFYFSGQLNPFKMGSGLSLLEELNFSYKSLF